jgi:hypothetical protein
MDLKDQIKLLADRIESMKENILTEEATKTAIIMPFIQMLGYDVFNPNEVIPEFTCDIGTKKGEKVDYAIAQNGKAVLLVECKHWGENLNAHADQLLRYFGVSDAKFGLLTNGIVYKFYTDLEEPNKMDIKPFLEVSLADIKETHIDELKKFHKSHFDVEKILDSASSLKYSNELKHVINEEFSNPSSDFVKLFCRKVYEKNMTPKTIEYFTGLLKKSIQSHISEKITERLKSALAQEKTEATANEQVVESSDEKDQVVTTVEEMEGYMIVKAIARSKVDVSRIIYKDTAQYFGIMVDNLKKTFCRLYFNGKNKYITIIDETGKHNRFDIDSLDDIYKHSDNIISAISFHTDK